MPSRPGSWTRHAWTTAVVLIMLGGIGASGQGGRGTQNSGSVTVSQKSLDDLQRRIGQLENQVKTLEKQVRALEMAGDLGRLGDDFAKPRQGNPPPKEPPPGGQLPGRDNTQPTGRVKAPFVVEDRNGRELLSVVEGATGPLLKLYGANREAAVELVSTPFGGELLARNRGGVTVASIAAGKSQAGGMIISDSQEKPVAVLGRQSTFGGRTALTLYNGDGNLALLAGEADGGYGRLQVYQRGGKVLGAGVNGTGRIATFGNGGEIKAFLGTAEGGEKGEIGLQEKDKGSGVYIAATPGGGFMQINKGNSGITMGLKDGGLPDICLQSEARKREACYSVLAAKNLMPY